MSAASGAGATGGTGAGAREEEQGKKGRRSRGNRRSSSSSRSRCRATGANFSERRRGGWGALTAGFVGTALVRPESCTRGLFLFLRFLLLLLLLWLFFLLLRLLLHTSKMSFFYFFNSSSSSVSWCCTYSHTPCHSCDYNLNEVVLRFHYFACPFFRFL